MEAILDLQEICNIELTVPQYTYSLQNVIVIEQHLNQTVPGRWKLNWMHRK